MPRLRSARSRETGASLPPVSYNTGRAEPIDATRVEPSPERFLREAEVERLVALSRTTIWRMRRRGLFPGSYELSTGAGGWRLSDIVRWMESRKPSRSASDGAASAGAGGAS